MEPINKHGLDLIDKSPFDYWYNCIRFDREDYIPSETTLFNNALRIAVFSPHKFEPSYIKVPPIDKRSNVGKAEYLALQSVAELQSKLLISESDYNKILKMRAEILKHATASQLCSGDNHNARYDYHEKESDVVIKFSPHFVNKHGIIVNLNATKDISLHNFQKESWASRNDKKAAIYLDGSDNYAMVFIDIELSEPHKISVRYFDQRSLDFGRETYLKNCKTYAECCKTGIWELNPEIIEASLPEWAFKQ